MGCRGGKDPLAKVGRLQHLVREPAGTTLLRHLQSAWVAGGKHAVRAGHSPSAGRATWKRRAGGGLEIVGRELRWRKGAFRAGPGRDAGSSSGTAAGQLAARQPGKTYHGRLRPRGLRQGAERVELADARAPRRRWWWRHDHTLTRPFRSGQGDEPQVCDSSSPELQRVDVGGGERVPSHLRGSCPFLAPAGLAVKRGDEAGDVPDTVGCAAGDRRVLE